MNKILCSCGCKASWDYLPGFSSGDSSYFCDDCVGRGCSCNHRYVDINAYHPPLDNPDLPDGIEGEDWKWLEQDKVWCYIDDKGREYPCAEYDYSEEGYDIDDEDEPGHFCPYCGHKEMQINNHYAHIEFEHPGKPIIK